MAASSTAAVPVATIQSSANATSAGYAAVVTPHDSTNYERLAKGFYVGGTGNVVAVLADDTTCLFSALPVGKEIMLVHKRINSTNTTATLIVAYF